MSQIAKKKFPRAMLLGGLSVNLNHLKTLVKRMQWSQNIMLLHVMFYNIMLVQ